MSWTELRGLGRCIQCSEGDLKAIRSAADRLKATCLVVDVGGVRSSRELFSAIAQNRALAPEHFGENWDALADIVDDLSWTPLPRVLIVWKGADSFRRRNRASHDKLIAVVGRVPEYDGEPYSDREVVSLFLEP